MIMILIGFTGCASEMSRGSSKMLYTIADVLEVHREDIGKEISLTLNQKLFFNFELDPETPGQWKMAEYERRVLLLLNEEPRVASGCWGTLLQARALGSGDVVLRFFSADEEKEPQDVTFHITIRR